jgi:hypothetical protein
MNPQEKNFSDPNFREPLPPYLFSDNISQIALLDKLK